MIHRTHIAWSQLLMVTFGAITFIAVIIQIPLSIMGFVDFGQLP